MRKAHLNSINDEFLFELKYYLFVVPVYSRVEFSYGFTDADLYEKFQFFFIAPFTEGKSVVLCV